jgi:hypothetical protein
MNRQILERQPDIDEILAQEQRALREMQLIRDQEMEGLHDRVLQFEESGGIRIVSYNDYEKETLFRDPDGKEQVTIEKITLDDKNELDSMFETISEYEEMANDIREVDEEKELDTDFSTDEIEQDDMEYDD